MKKINVLNKKEISTQCILLALSFWLILFSFEGSFMMVSLTPIIFVNIVAKLVKRESLFKLNFIDKLFVALIIILIISTTINFFIHDDLISIDAIIGIVYFIGIFLWFSINTKEAYKEKEINLIIKCYILSSVICSLFIIFRYFAGADGKIALINLVGTRIDPNYISAFIAVACIYLFMDVLKKPKNRIVNLILLIILVFSVFLIGSRASLLGLLLSMIIAFCIYFFKNITKAKIIYSMIFLICAIIIGSKILSTIPEWTLNRYFDFESYFDDSNSERINIWNNAVEGIIDQPLTGYGVGVFNKIEKFKYVQYGKITRTIPKTAPGHNTYLDIALYFGLIGLLIFMIILCSIFFKCFKKQNRELLPIVFMLVFLTVILGADKSVVLWNNLIILTIMLDYNNNNNLDVKNK